jgi:hypothetical protein
MHNVIVRQLADDLRYPPKEEPESQALGLLADIMVARQEGKSLEPYKDRLAQEISSSNELNTMTWRLYRRYRVSKLVRWLKADDEMDRFLLRCFTRGDFTPTELLIFKKLSQSNVKELAEELLAESREGISEMRAEDVLTKLDIGSKITEGSQFLSRTTPQGREIVRKLVFTARRRLQQR